MSDDTKPTKETKKVSEDVAAVTRPDNGAPEAGKIFIATQGGTTIKTHW